LIARQVSVAGGSGGVLRPRRGARGAEPPRRSSTTRSKAGSAKGSARSPALGRSTWQREPWRVPSGCWAHSQPRTPQDQGI